MTVDYPNVIDFVAYDPKSDRVLLVLVEYREWGAAGELLPDLERKLDGYLQQVLSGEHEQAHPRFAGKVVRFDLRAIYPPGPREVEFLEIVRRSELTPRGIELVWSYGKLDSDNPD